MNKNFITFFLILIFGLMFVGFVSGAATEVKISKSLVDKFENQNEDKVRVLIKLKNENELPNRYFEIFSNKRETFEKINIDKSNINKEARGYVSAYINKEELEKLKTNEFITSVDIEQTYHTLLQDSVGIMNISPTWNLKKDNLNLTGTGQTVCIIDTGVNYSHSDLGGGYGNNTNFSYKIIGGWDFCKDDSTCSTEDDDPMDAEGHGTHVSGIVAASGSITGTGPNVKIVMMKASNSSGTFFTTEIVSAIDWCVDNSSIFNISVISMSLGGGLYSGYCDTENADNELMASAINDAVTKNISVVVATGNNYNTTHISSPACITNATRVGAVNKNDNLIYNRNSLVKLFGIGWLVNSTVGCCGYNNYESWSGTSMATPMVAGAIALINQYLSLSGQTKTPQEIEAILNNTGKQINDSGYSNLNFSRIDVYSAILSLDIDAPNVTLISPIDNHINLTANQTFTCNATDWQLANITFYLWNSSHEIINQTSFNISGTENQTSFNITNLSYGNYEWNCLAFDEAGNSGNSTNYTLTIGGIFVNLISPPNNTYTNINETDFTCNLTSEETHELSNVTFYLWNSTGALINTTIKNISGTTNGTTFAYNLTEETNYNWNCLGVNNASYNSSAGNNFTITYDTVAPEINLSEVATGTSTAINFSFDVSDSNPVSNCSIYINGNETPNTSAINNSGANIISVSGLSVGTHNAYINCTDGAGNIENSSTISFTINSPPVTPSSSSGGGSSSSITSIATAPKVYEATISEITGGYTQKLKKNEKINFSIFDFNGGRHLLSVNEVGADYVDLTIESEPINLRLGIGQSAKLNLTSEIYYDLLVKLNSITDGTAELTIQLINEPIKVQAIEIVKEEIVKIETIESEGYFWLVIILVVVLLSVLAIVIKLNKKKLKTLKPKKKHGKKRKKTKT